MRANVVLVETGGGEGDKSSAGRDGKGWVEGSVLDAGERLVDGKCAREMFGSLFPQSVAAHAVKTKGNTSVSGC